MSPDDAAKQILSAILITREDIARAKSWIVQTRGTNTSGMADQWLREQDITEVREVDTQSQDCSHVLVNVARAYSVRLAFYQAAWELVSTGILFPSPSSRWEPNLGYNSAGSRGGIEVRKSLTCTFPERIERPPLAITEPADPDIFLKGVDCTTLQSGILEAIEQTLTCFRQGLYMPATAMLAAAAEATWMECAQAVSKHLSSPTLQKVLADQPSFAKMVVETRKALEHKGAKVLLDTAGQAIYNVLDAEVWTTALRERRNALHWGKAKSFIADHSETGTLLMAAPQHLATLEAIRKAC